MNSLSRSRHRGVSLLEVLSTIIILATFTLIAGRLTGETIRLPHQMNEQQTSEAKIDSMIGRLRSDVWGCSSIKVESDHEVRIGEGVVWKLVEKGQIQRTGEGATRQWNDLSKGLRFESDGSTLWIKSSEGPEVRLVSQVMLAGRGS